MDHVTICLIFSSFKECIKPVKIDRKPGKVGKIRIEDDGSYTEIDQVKILYVDNSYKQNAFCLSTTFYLLEGF